MMEAAKYDILQDKKIVACERLLYALLILQFPQIAEMLI